MNFTSTQKSYIIGTVLYFCFVALALSSFQPIKENTIETKIQSAMEKLEEPNDWFMMQRTYPDAAFDYTAYHAALKNISNEVNNRQNMRTKSIQSGWNAAWTTEGPGNIGGRINVVTVHPTNQNIIYLGNSTGGIFKTIDGGTTWTPIFDVQSYLSIGCITLDPTNPNIIYVGTGDPNISGSAFIGDGVYKSTDAGVTWTHLGLTAERIISKIAVNTLHPNIVYAAAMGIPFLPTPDRGLYKSTDGGTTWNQVLHISDSAGVIDLVMDPSHPDTLYAAGWDRLRNNQMSYVHGNHALIYKTTNGGVSWTTLAGGLPIGDYSRISLSMSGVNHNTLFASYSDTTYNLYKIYKTTNNGTTWAAIPTSTLNNPFNGQGWYSGGVHVNPTNDNQIWLCGVDLYKTTNGGTNWSLGAPDWSTYIVHGDMHDVEFFNATTIFITTDGGLYKTTDAGNNWTKIENIPNNQFYHCTYDPFNLGTYAGGVQDNGTTNGNASTLTTWGRIFGGDGFTILYHPTDASVIWAETQNGGIVISNDGGNTFSDGTTGINTADIRNWDMQYIMSHFSPDVLYTGTTKVYQNTFGSSPYWQAISPDLVSSSYTNDPKFHTITCVAESNSNASNLYAGTSDGLVWSSTNGGNTWNNVTNTLPNRYVTCMKTSYLNAGVAYVSHSGYRDNDFIPHIHKTTNNGTTLTDISGDLPQIAVNCIMTYPTSDNILFVGTDGGVYGTLNGGINWIRVGSNMPIIPTYDLQYDGNNHKILAGTFARSLMTYSMDSILTATDIKAPQNMVNISIYPNPTTDFVKISIHQSNSGNATLTILNSKGETISKTTIGTQQEINYPAKNLANGLYFVKIEGPTISETKRFVKL